MSNRCRERTSLIALLRLQVAIGITDPLAPPDGRLSDVTSLVTFDASALVATVVLVSDVVRLDLGDDIFKAQLIAAACEADGLRVQLIRNEHLETGALHALQPAYLLVAGDDVARVQEIISRSD